MDAYAVGIAASILLTAVFVWLLQPVAYRFGLVDRPGGRKHHSLPTPITGGLAIAAAVLVTIFATSSDISSHWAYACGSALLIVVGLLDDAYDVRWTWRILAQVCAGLIMVYGGGVQVAYVGIIFTDAPIVLGGLAVPFTIFATVGIINAINMCDGSDGLAGSMCFAAMVMIGAAALYAGNQPLFANLVPIMAAILAFLAFNMRFPWQSRAKVFLGNAGSAFLGYTIAWVVFRLTQNAAHPVSPVLAPLLLAPPLIDCLVLIARRLKLGRSPFHADRDHMHHLLLEAGFSPNTIALGLMSVSVVIGLSAALVLRTNAGSEGHLVLGFGALLVGYYWLTAQRSRALAVLRRVHQFFSGPTIRELAFVGDAANDLYASAETEQAVTAPDRRVAASGQDRRAMRSDRRVAALAHDRRMALRDRRTVATVPVPREIEPHDELAGARNRAQH